ncbi:hypothetical protein E9228_003108 [Curtobacterium flaccumfaciens]|uniref:CAAX prenyl protease 2/Lysostaphin resistance protein A-like domain-containing protein n=1 Tax=Curtobacterium salicis TaxID=1779862 RepID=A0ABX0TEW8_9MICO|nr:hypothetical protein [Curtobacterium sp. WW7]
MPWSEVSAGIIVVVLIGALGVGVGEELYFRGVLVTALRAHHSEFVVLIVSSVVFGLAHVVGFVIAGLPIGLILFQVTFLSMDGALFYAARRATGKLWVPMLPALSGLRVQRAQVQAQAQVQVQVQVQAQAQAQAQAPSGAHSFVDSCPTAGRPPVHGWRRQR